MQYCVQNSIVSGTGAPDTGVLTVYPPASSYIILAGIINTIGGGGTHGVASGGAAADAATVGAILLATAVESVGGAGAERL